MHRGANGYTLSSWLFARALGLVVLAAFISLGAQALGLFGARGVVPIAAFVESAKRAGHSFWQHPSALWWSSSDTAITLVWTAGIVAALALTLGLLPKVALFVSWFAYLSFVSLGWPFMSFQWDTLLLETTFTAFFFVPWRAWDRLGDHPEPHRLARFALWWLLFRLVFRSGYVKLASGDPTWADLSALTYHYWTQPLPNAVAWYVNLLPDWFHELSCLGMFAIELGAPLLILVPRAWARRAAAAAIAGLMVLIALTGNYGFFNLLTIVLCVPLLDDACLRRDVRPKREQRLQKPHAWRRSIWPNVAPAMLIAVTAIVFFTGTFGARTPRLLKPLYPFATFNNYGLFAVMTTERREIEIEGSRDGETWEPYVFPYKPGPVERAPAQAAPHQPRLDWQMWFAALGDHRRNPWLASLMRRLLEDEPSVVELFESTPFGDEPPLQVRALIYPYTPTTWKERSEAGHWWKRGRPMLYAPVLGTPSRSSNDE